MVEVGVTTETGRTRVTVASLIIKGRVGRMVMARVATEEAVVMVRIIITHKVIVMASKAGEAAAVVVEVVMEDSRLTVSRDTGSSRQLARRIRRATVQDTALHNRRCRLIHRNLRHNRHLPWQQHHPLNRITTSSSNSSSNGTNSGASGISKINSTTVSTMANTTVSRVMAKAAISRGVSRNKMIIM